MNKVGIVSCYSQPNYGSMLQAYATQIVLDKLGYNNETINVSGFQSELKKRKIIYFIKASICSTIILTKIGRVRSVFIRKFCGSEYSRNIDVRNNAFKRFEKEHFRLSARYSSIKKLEENCNLYSSIIVGSDQLWLPANIEANYYTLSFVPDNINRISYATSFGQSKLPKNIARKAKNFLEKINYLSVREEAGAELVYKLIGKKVPVLCDPTMLLNEDDWNLIRTKDVIVEGKYIFVYFLGRNKLHRDFVVRLKNRTGLKVVCLPHIDEFVKYDEACADELLYDIEPGDFLNLISNAEFVCTDSFHCSVFSIIYKKYFFAFKRFSDNNKFSTNCRILNLLNGLEIDERLILGNENIDIMLQGRIDYGKVYEKIKINRKYAYDFLKNALEKKEQ